MRIRMPCAGIVFVVAITLLGSEIQDVEAFEPLYEALYEGFTQSSVFGGISNGGASLSADQPSSLSPGSLVAASPPPVVDHGSVSSVEGQGHSSFSETPLLQSNAPNIWNSLRSEYIKPGNTFLVTSSVDNSTPLFGPATLVNTASSDQSTNNIVTSPSADQTRISATSFSAPSASGSVPSTAVDEAKVTTPSTTIASSVASTNVDHSTSVYPTVLFVTPAPASLGSESFLPPMFTSASSEYFGRVDSSHPHSSSRSAIVSSASWHASPSPATTGSVSSTVTAGPPRHCGEALAFCQHGSRCLNGTEDDRPRVYCVCTGDYYGDRCQKSLSSLMYIPHSQLYKQLTYAFAGTTVFLMIVMILWMVCSRSCRMKRNDVVTLKYSHELEEFDIKQPRVSVVKKNPYVLNAYDVYGERNEGCTEE